MLRNWKTNSLSMVFTIGLGISTPPALGQDGGLPNLGEADIGSADNSGSPETKSSTANAASACDELAADPLDEQKAQSVGGVVKVSAEAVSVCLSAVENNPQSARLNYQAGRALRSAGDQVRAFYYLDRAQSLGSRRALVQVADAYISGAGVAKDEGRAIELFKQAATQGDKEAAIRIGEYYSKGASKNLELAVQWLAGSKTAEGYLALGDLYRDEYKNNQIALKWYFKAADLNLPKGYERLGLAFYEGLGVPQDKEQALKWLSLAWKGLPDASETISRLEKIGDGYKPLLWLETGATRESFFAAAEGDILYNSDKFTEALQYYNKSADMGNVNAFRDIGYMYIKGKGVEKDVDRGIELMKRSNPKYTACILGDTYYSRTPPDFTSALTWYQVGAEGGNFKCMLMIGMMHENGSIEPKDYKEALHWFQRIVDQAEDTHWAKARAMYEIAALYRLGKGLEKDIRRAGEWYERSASLGYKGANYTLASMFAEGNGCRPDADLAARLMEIAIRSDAQARDTFKSNWQLWDDSFLRVFQSRLKELGLYNGVIDGRYGKETLAAIDLLHDRGEE